MSEELLMTPIQIMGKIISENADDFMLKKSSFYFKCQSCSEWHLLDEKAMTQMVNSVTDDSKRGK